MVTEAVTTRRLQAVTDPDPSGKSRISFAGALPQAPDALLCFGVTRWHILYRVIFMYIVEFKIFPSSESEDIRTIITLLRDLNGRDIRGRIARFSSKIGCGDCFTVSLPSEVLRSNISITVWTFSHKSSMHFIKCNPSRTFIHPKSILHSKSIMH